MLKCTGIGFIVVHDTHNNSTKLTIIFDMIPLDYLGPYMITLAAPAHHVFGFMRNLLPGDLSTMRA